MTAKEFYESWADKNGFWQPQQAYIIALGNNDILYFITRLAVLRTSILIHRRIIQTHFFGNLGRILSRLKSLEKNARIFLVSMQRRGEEECDAVIRQIACEMKKVCRLFSFTYLIDMTNDGPIYDETMRKTFALGFHPNPVGYYCYALMVGNYIDYLIRRFPKDFFEVPFIGTSLKNKDV